MTLFSPVPPVQWTFGPLGRHGQLTDTVGRCVNVVVILNESEVQAAVRVEESRGNPAAPGQAAAGSKWVRSPVSVKTRCSLPREICMANVWQRQMRVGNLI